MKALIVTPAPKGSLVGNRQTAQRYARILRALGVRASVEERWLGDRCDILVALHAKKSAGSIAKFAETHPLTPLVVVVTGTDVYDDVASGPEVAQSLELATRIVVLQKEALKQLPAHLHPKTRVILQSAERAKGEAKPLDGVFEIAALGHLRGVKDPFLAAAAARMLPEESHIRVAHVGAVLDRGMEDQARDESADNPRWRWLGERTHAASLHVLARARAFVQTSLNEGGSSALAEAIVAHKPIVCTRIPGAVGMLGADHPGFFETGDVRGLAELLQRLEEDDEWRATLTARSVVLAPRFALEAETEAWRALLEELDLASERPRFRLTQVRRSEPGDDLANAVLAGLASVPKRLPCRFFYDETGSRIFEEICALPEYYLTRAEDEILAQRAREIVALVPKEAEIVELGSGSATKTKHLIAAAIERDGRARYTPIDISRAALEDAGRSLTAEFETLQVDAVLAEYQDGLEHLVRAGRGPRLYTWLGSNVGNFDRAGAAQFLTALQHHLDIEDRLVIGIDRRKEKSVLEAAYDDSRGVTARFNLNILKRISAELDCAIDLERFRHVAFYDEIEGRIEMHLESRVAQSIAIPRLDLVVPLAAGERIHTENSYKYSDAEIQDLAHASGMSVQRVYHDARERFALCVFAPAH